MTAAGPPFTVIEAGYTDRGQAWVLVRRRGGRLARVFVHPAVTDLWVLLATVAQVVSSLPDHPGAGVF